MKFDYTLQPGLVEQKREMKAGEMPLISIITPYYNGKKYIDQTYQCVVNQTFPYFEWIIVDDGSTDQESLDKLEEVASRDSRIKVFHKENGGPADTRNYGVKKAITEYVCPLDSDDLIEPTYLEYCWWMLEKNPKAAWSFTGSVGFQNQEYIWDPEFNPLVMKKSNLLSVTAVIRKKEFEKIGGYDCSKLKHYHEDWHFWLRMIASANFPVQSRGESLFWYRRRENGEFSTTENKKDGLHNKLIAKAADKVIHPHKPVIYPGTVETNWEKPVVSSWNRVLDNKKISVAFLIPWLEMGGADKFNFDLIEGLDSDAFEIGIITTEKAKNEWIQKARALTADVFNLPNFVDPKDYAEFVTYYIKSRKVNVLFVSNSYHGYYMIPWLRENFPELAIVDYIHMEEWYWRNGGYARASGALQAISERTYVCNNATRRVMMDIYHMPQEQVETVHIGVDADQFDRNLIRPGMLYQELELDSQRPVVLFICRLHPQKRPFLMLEVAKVVKKRVPDVAFVVVGDGEQKEQLKNAVEKADLQDTVLFVGARKEVRPYYRDAKITLITSLKEGLALTAYESCAMGVPVISADVGGQSDLIDDEVGRLIPCMQDEESEIHKKNFKKQEIYAYADAIVEILTNEEKWNTLSQNCRKRILEGFTIDAMVEYFDKEFRRLVEDKSLLQQRQSKAEALKMLAPLAEDIWTMELQEYSAEFLRGRMPRRERDFFIYEGCQDFEVYGAYNDGRVNGLECAVNRHEEVVNRHEEVVNRHEEVVNRHEEVVNRHEEVVNRHEDAINHQWGIQKWHEDRISALEQRTFKGVLKKIYRKLFRR